MARGAVEGPRRILHCDMDCFYAAIHMRDDPELRGKPVLIGGSAEGRGVVAAASYEARRFGVRSATPSVTARRLCPQAIFIPPDFPRYRAESEQIFAILRDMASSVQPVSIDEAYVDATDRFGEWGSATAMAEAIRERVRRERGLTMSVGVGPNKLVAKIASDFRKPDGLTVVHPARVVNFLAPLSVRALPGVGPATQTRLARRGIRRVEDLRRWEESDLERRFGRFGKALARYARGEDDRPVRARRVRKSISGERTYAEDLTTSEAILAEVDRLADRLAGGLERKQLVARTVSIKVRYANFDTVTRSLTLPAPSRDRETLRECARRLLRRTEAGRRAVRLLGVGGSNLLAADRGQLELFGG